MTMLKINDAGNEDADNNCNKLEAKGKIDTLGYDNPRFLHMLEKFEKMAEEDNMILENDIFRAASFCKKIGKLDHAEKLFKIFNEKLHSAKEYLERNLPSSSGGLSARH